MVFMTKEKVMNSPEQKKSGAEEKQPSTKRSDDRSQADDQSQATSEEFEEEGMGVAPKE